MDVINFPGKIAQFGLLKKTDIVPANDLLVIGKKVNYRRDGSQYEEMAMPVSEFLAMIPPPTITKAYGMFYRNNQLSTGANLAALPWEATENLFNIATTANPSEIRVLVGGVYEIIFRSEISTVPV